MTLSVRTVAALSASVALASAVAFFGLVRVQSQALEETAVTPIRFGALTVRIEPETNAYLYDFKRPVLVTLRHEGDLLAAWQGSVHFGLNPSATLRGLPVQAELLRDLSLLLSPRPSPFDRNDAGKTEAATLGDVLRLDFSLSGALRSARYDVPARNLPLPIGTGTGSGTDDGNGDIVHEVCRIGAFSSVYDASSSDGDLIWRANFEGAQCVVDGLRFETGPQTAELVMDENEPYRFTIRGESDGWSNPYASAKKSVVSWTSGVEGVSVWQTLEAHTESVAVAAAALPGMPPELARPFSLDLSVSIENTAPGALPTVSDVIATAAEAGKRSNEYAERTAERMDKAFEEGGADVFLKEFRLRAGSDVIAVSGTADVPPAPKNASAEPHPVLPTAKFDVELSERVAKMIAPLVGVGPDRFDQVFPLRSDAAAGSEKLRVTTIEVNQGGVRVNGELVL